MKTNLNLCFGMMGLITFFAGFTFNVPAQAAGTYTVAVKTKLIYLVDDVCTEASNERKRLCFTTQRELGELDGELSTNEEGGDATLKFKSKTYSVEIPNFSTIRDAGPLALRRTLRPRFLFKLSPDSVKELMIDMGKQAGPKFASKHFLDAPFGIQWVTQEHLQELIERFTAYDNSGSYSIQAFFSRYVGWFKYKKTDSTVTTLSFRDDPDQFKERLDVVIDVGNKIKFK